MKNQLMVDEYYKLSHRIQLYAETHDLQNLFDQIDHWTKQAKPAYRLTFQAIFNEFQRDIYDKFHVGYGDKLLAYQTIHTNTGDVLINIDVHTYNYLARHANQVGFLYQYKRTEFVDAEKFYDFKHVLSMDDWFKLQRPSLQWMAKFMPSIKDRKYQTFMQTKHQLEKKIKLRICDHYFNVHNTITLNQAYQSTH